MGAVLAGYAVLSALIGQWGAASGARAAARTVLLEGLLLALAAGVSWALVRRYVVRPWQTLAQRDDLTGLLRPAAFWTAAETAVADAITQHRPVAFVFLDLDDFKRFNDRAGHLAGDAVLRVFGRLLADGARTTDVVGRIGGEEFGWVLPGTTPDQAHHAVVRLLAACRAEAGMAGLTFSAGVAGWVPGASAENAWTLAHRADAALYTAKAAGKAHAVVAAAPEDPGHPPPTIVTFTRASLGRDGQAAVEFALILPIALFMALGFLALFAALSAREAVQTAASVAVRTVAAGQMPTASQIQQALQMGIGLQGVPVTIEPVGQSCPTDQTTPGACVQVLVSSQPGPQTGETTLTATGGMSVQPSPQGPSYPVGTTGSLLGIIPSLLGAGQAPAMSQPEVVLHGVQTNGPLGRGSAMAAVTVYYYHYVLLQPAGRWFHPITWQMGPVTVPTTLSPAP